MRFLAPYIFGLLFAWAVGTVASNIAGAELQRAVALFPIAGPP